MARMVEHDKFSADVMELEHLLVRQFRTLQELLESTQKERVLLLNGTGTDVMRVVEDKEVLLDQLGILEDSRRRVVEDIAVALKVQSEAGSVGSLLPHLGRDESSRIGRLAEGIINLAGQTREMNQQNKALAVVKLDWIRAAQVTLIGLSQPEGDYRPAIGGPVSREAAGWGMTSMEVRA
jgi:flagellar biosynthesis/type III secretory pathway chaperone